MKEYRGPLGEKDPESITARDVFSAFDKGDELAGKALDRASNSGAWRRRIA